MILLNSIDDFLKIDRHGEYLLCCDIDFEGKQIPKLLDDFRGVLDGNGHKIKNLVISRCVRFDGEPVALFASARNAEIKNISFDNLRICVDNDGYRPEVACLCVMAERCRFSNIVVCITDSECIPLVYDSNECMFAQIRHPGLITHYSENDCLEEEK